MKIYCDLITQQTFVTPKTILEIGSHNANDANYMRMYFNLNFSDVWVVEPNPLKQKEILLNYPEINLVGVAINNKVGESDFNQVLGSNDETSSLLNRVDSWYKSNNVNKIKVETITGQILLDLINLPEIDICKIDVEGLTFEVLESFGENITKIKSFHLESEHSMVWENQKLYTDVEKFMLSKNYKQIYFEYVAGGRLQSDSIWILKNLIR
jgi:FkbM family methyltransferase